MIKLTATPESRQDVEELAAFFEGLKSPTLSMRQELGDVVRLQFAFRFINEGSPTESWRALRPLTNALRWLEGYPKYHPILKREGDYRRSFTDPTNADNYEMTILRPDGWSMEFGSSDFRVNELEGGRDESTFMAARPVTLLENSEEDEIGDTLDRIFQQAADDMGLVRGS